MKFQLDIRLPIGTRRQVRTLVHALVISISIFPIFAKADPLKEFRQTSVPANQIAEIQRLGQNVLRAKGSVVVPPSKVTQLDELRVTVKELLATELDESLEHSDAQQFVSPNMSSSTPSQLPGGVSPNDPRIKKMIGNAIKHAPSNLDEKDVQTEKVERRKRLKARRDAGWGRAGKWIASTKQSGRSARASARAGQRMGLPDEYEMHRDSVFENIAGELEGMQNEDSSSRLKKLTALQSRLEPSAPSTPTIITEQPSGLQVRTVEQRIPVKRMPQ